MTLSIPIFVKEIKTSEGYNTRAWEVISTIEEYVYGIVRIREHQLELWKKNDETTEIP